MPSNPNIKLILPDEIWIPYSSKRDQPRATVEGKSGARRVIAGVANYSIPLSEWIKRKIEDGEFEFATIKRYNSGSNCLVTASGEGIVTTKSQGVVVITVPEDVELLSFRFVGSSSDLNNGELRIFIVGGENSGTEYNTSDNNLFHPFISVQNRNVVLPSDNYQQQPYAPGGSITIFHERSIDSGQSSVKITGLTGSFGILGQL